MFRLLAIFSVVASMLTSSVLANPTFPGTCLVSGMGDPHGSTPATDANYTVSVKQTATAATGNTYTVTIDGDGTITGLLLYATDTASKARFGSFTNIPKGYAPLTTCKGENPKTNTLGHNSELAKNLPATFTWTDGGHSAGKTWAGSFTGILMSSTITTWYVVPPTAVTGGSSAVNATSSSGASSSSGAATNASTATNNSSSPTNSTPSAATATAQSSAVRLDSSLVLCLLLSAFALSARL